MEALRLCSQFLNQGSSLVLILCCYPTRALKLSCSLLLLRWVGPARRRRCSSWRATKTDSGGCNAQLHFDNPACFSQTVWPLSGAYAACRLRLHHATPPCTGISQRCSATRPGPSFRSRPLLALAHIAWPALQDDTILLVPNSCLSSSVGSHDPRFNPAKHKPFTGMIKRNWVLEEMLTCPASRTTHVCSQGGRAGRRRRQPRAAGGAGLLRLGAAEGGGWSLCRGGRRRWWYRGQARSSCTAAHRCPGSEVGGRRREAYQVPELPAFRCRQ